MGDQNVQLRLARAGAELTLNGDAETVRNILGDLTSRGLGGLSEFFYEDQTQPTQGSQTGGQSTTGTSGSASSASDSLAFFSYRIDTIQLPRTSTESAFAFDLDGDSSHRPDNALANLWTAFGTGSMFDFNGATADALSNGRVNYLLRLQTTDTQLLNDSNVLLTVLRARPELPGSGSFTVDESILPVVIKGSLIGGHFLSEDPLITGDPHSFNLVIAEPSNNNFIEFPLQAVRFEFDVDPDSVRNGKLGGAVIQGDIMSHLVPAFADTLTAIAGDQSPAGDQVRQIFDIGGGGSQAGDLKIDTEEFLSSPLVQALLTPDLSLFDSEGKYSPHTGTAANAFSFGCGFTATKAQF